MKAGLCSVLILLSILIINTEQQKICSNGVFKCVSPVSLRICFLDKLVTSEFFCPNSTFCNEKSPTICTKIPVALPAIQYYEESTTIDAEIYPDYPEIQCTEPGVFEVENTGCTTYLNCSNSEVAQESTCDEVSLFNPETKTCNEDYICPESLDYIQYDNFCSEANDPFICAKVGNFPMPNTNCLKYIYCKKIYIGLKPIQKYCPQNTLFDPLLGKCTKEYICKDECTTTSASITTIEQETTPTDSPKCPGAGKFPVPNTNCTTYRLCVTTTNGIIYKDYVCPSGSYYNPDKKSCSTNYHCWPQITTTQDPNLTDLPVTNSTLDDSTLTTPDECTSSSIPDDSISTDSTANSTPDNSTPNSAPADSTPNSTPDDSKPNSTPDDFTPNSTPDDSKPNSTPDDVTPNSTPDDFTPSSIHDVSTSNSTPDDSTPNSTPDDSTPNSIPDDSTPTDSISDSTPYNSTPNSTTDDFTPNSTPNDSKPNSSPDDFTPSSIPNDSTPTDSTSNSTPDNTTLNSTPADLTPNSTSDNSTPSSIPDDSILTDSTSNSTPDNSTPNTTPADSTPNSTPDDSKPNSTPDDSTPNSTPDDFTPSLIPDVSTSKSTPDDYTPNSTPNANSTPDITTPNSIPDDSTPTDSISYSTPDNSTPNSTTDDFTPNSTPNDSEPNPSPDDSTPSSIPNDSTPTDSTSNSTPDNSTLNSTPADLTPNSTPDDSKPNSTPDDSTPNSTPDDFTPSSIHEDSTSNSTLDDSTPNSTPDDLTPNSTPDDSTPSSIPDDSIPTDSTSNITLDNSTPNSTPANSTPNLTSDDSTPNSTPDDSTPYSTSDDSSPNSIPDISTPNSIPDSSTPESTDTQDITTPSTSITTIKDITDGIPSDSTKDPDSSTTTSDGFTENSTDAQVTTTYSNPVTTQDSSLNITDLSSTTENIVPNTTDDSFSTTCKTDSTTTSEFITDDAKPTITSSTTEYSTENTEYSNETSSHSSDEETTTSSNSAEDDSEITTPTIDCRNQGRLPVLNTKCKMYYQCTLTTSGYKYVVYECSEGNLYDPYKKICSDLYTCPETILSTTDKSEPDVSTTTIDYTVSDSDETSEDIEVELNCTESGKVPVPNTDCLLYGQCTLTTSGFIQSIYECPKGTLYDPEMKLCSTSYVCSEIIPDDTTTDKAITTTIIDNPPTEPNELSSISTVNPEIPSPIVPSCTEQGKFPILNTNCKSYISCILTTSGFVTTEYICSKNLLFDPNLKKCSSNYICKENIVQFPKNQEVETTKEDENKLTTVEPDFEKCTESGRFPILNSKCTQYIMCSSTATGFKFKIYTCPINSFYDPEHQRCSQTYSCSELDSTTEAPLPTTSTDQEIPECHQNGKFSINNTGCTKYILCSLTSTGFRSKIYTCPEDSFFNPEMKRCQMEYICPELSTDLETTTEMFDLEESSEECVNVLKEMPVCTKTGKFPISGTNCKQYVLCTQTSLGFRSKIYDCPNDANFDPNKKRCMLSYNCTEKICPNKSMKLIKKPIITECKAPGKFSIKGTHCKKFKLCVWTNMRYIKTVYDCPNGTNFDPRLQLCSENYICAEDISYSCTTIGQFKDLFDTTCQYYFSCKANSDDIVRGERKICPRDYYFDPVIQKCSANYMCKKKFARAIDIAPKFLINGQCTTVGRYAIAGTNCKQYMYCADNGDGTLKGTQFTCPTTSVFNQAIQKCAATYICPDSVCNFLGRVPNPNSRDCTSYIECEDFFDPITGMFVSTGRVVFCPIGQKFDPIIQVCCFNYVCRL